VFQQEKVKGADQVTRQATVHLQILENENVSAVIINANLNAILFQNFLIPNSLILVKITGSNKIPYCKNLHERLKYSIQT
jgi:hypothetical protein